MVVASTLYLDLFRHVDEYLCLEGMIRAGFASDDLPRAVFRSFIGRPGYPSVSSLSLSREDFFVGDDAQSRRGVLNMKYSIGTIWNRFGIIQFTMSSMSIPESVQFSLQTHL